MIEYHAGRWKTKAGLPRSSGRSAAQARGPEAVFNHLKFWALLRVVGAKLPIGSIHAAPVA